MKIRKPKWHFNIYKSKCWTWKPGFYYLNELLWKDKYNTPRTEREPHFTFWWGYWTFEFKQGDDQEWEQYLWITKYCENNFEKAKETWGWIDYKTRLSTWKDEYYV